MIRYNIDDLLDKTKSRYTLIIAVAKRARQIKDYLNAVKRHEIPHVVPPQVDLEETVKEEAISIALKELADSKLEYSQEEKPA